MVYIKRTFPCFAKSTISPSEMAHFRGQYRPYRTLIWALSHCEMGNIRKQNAAFRTMVRGISRCSMMGKGLYYE